jgi:hypothetical protein
MVSHRSVFSIKIDRSTQRLSKGRIPYIFNLAMVKSHVQT